MPRTECTYWSDPLCIWAFVAQARLASLMANHRDDLTVLYRIVPVFGSIPWRFREGPWADKGPSGRADATRDIASRFGHDDVSGRVWLDDPPSSSWAPACAIKAVFAMEAAEQVESGAGASYQVRLREAFFVGNRNTARTAVQLETAETCGVPTDELQRRLEDGTAMAALWEDHRDRERLLIRGSPTFVFDDGRAMLYGNASEAVLRSTVAELVQGVVADCSPCV